MPPPSLSRNAAMLLAGNAISLLAPLVAVPYVARVLGPTAWGPVLLAQAIGNWLVVVLEFGFDLSGARTVAQSRNDDPALARVVRDVQSAKLLLVPVATVLLLAAFALTPVIADATALLGWTLAFVLFRGLNPFWFFQGVERLRWPVVLDTGTKVAAALGVFVVVHEPSHGARVVALQAGGALVSLLLLSARLPAGTRLPLPSLSRGIEMLRQSATLFVFRAASGLFAAANLIIVSLLASPLALAFFGGADRITRASINAIHPLTQVLLPRVSYLSTSDPGAAHRMVLRSLRVTGALGAAIGVVLLVGAPQLTRLLLGPGYEGAVPILRAFALLPPLVAIDTVLGLHWAVPFGFDRPFVVAVVIGGLLNLLLAILLVGPFGGVGVVAAILAGELVAFVALAHRFRQSAVA